jgi:hypothetical protein
VHDKHGFDGVLRIGTKASFQIGWRSASPPVAGHIVHLEAEFLCDLPPELREVAGLKHEHPVARRKGIDDGRFPGAGAGSREHHHGPTGLKNLPDALQHLAGKSGEFRAAVIQHRTGHR